MKFEIDDASVEGMHILNMFRAVPGNQRNGVYTIDDEDNLPHFEPFDGMPTTIAELIEQLKKIANSQKDRKLGSENRM